MNDTQQILWIRLGFIIACLGFGLPAFYSSLISAYILMAVLLAGVTSLCIKPLRLWGIALISFSLGAWHLHVIVDQQIPAELEQLPIAITAEIIGLPARTQNLERFQVKVRFAHCEACAQLPNALQNLTVRLSWRRHMEAQPLQPGEVWQLTVRLKRPRGFVNPAGFDYQAWLLQQGISATGYVVDTEDTALLSKESGFSISSLRYRLAEFIKHSPKVDLPFKGILLALAVGDKSWISQAQWNVLNQSGTTHLMAISGLHIGLVSTLAFLLMRLLLPLSPLGGHAVWMRMIPAVVSSCAALLYAALADFAIPTQRAVILVFMLNLAYLLGRKTSLFHLLFFAAALITFLDPFAFTQQGFWLSFAAVLVLLWCFSYRAKALGRVASVVKAQWVVGLGLLVPLLCLNLPVSYVSPLANIVAVPVLSLLCIPVLLIALAVYFVLPTAADFLLYFSSLSLAWVWEYLQWLTVSADTLWFDLADSLAVPILALTCIFCLMCPARLRLAVPCSVILVALYFFPKPSQNKMTVLDVGQGLAVVLQMFDEQNRRHTIVYDTGARLSPDFDIGSRVLVPFLRSEGIRHIDTLIISHGDNDHAGGLQGVLQNIAVKQLVMVDNTLATDAGASFTLPAQTQCTNKWHWHNSDISLRVLWPIEGEQRPLNRNNTSCVVLLEIHNHRVLLTGDIEETVENRLHAMHQLPTDVDVLLAPHHGSLTSSSLDFVYTTAARHVIFSAGFRNRYRHPAQRVVERYQHYGSQTWNTAELGAITIYFDKNERQLQIKAERERAKKPWF